MNLKRLQDQDSLLNKTAASVRWKTYMSGVNRAAAYKRLNKDESPHL